MKFGVREICDVVLKAKANQKIGNKIFYKGEPVIYFDTLKTSSMEGAATTVYAQGGRGNARLAAWEGERTVTFTMEDALISPAGFMILSGAGLIEATNTDKIAVHVAETTDEVYVDDASDPSAAYIIVNESLSDKNEADIYIMVMQNGEIQTEPYLGEKVTGTAVPSVATTKTDEKEKIAEALAAGKLVKVSAMADSKKSVDGNQPYDAVSSAAPADQTTKTPATGVYAFKDHVVVMADYYTDKGAGAQQIEITPDKFGGNYYLEASTLFRDTNGVDMPAEFIIPNCKIQSNFTFTMASSGDPSTFTFTMDAFPDYTRFNPTKKVLAVIQIISAGDTDELLYREETPSNHEADSNGIIVEK